MEAQSTDWETQSVASDASAMSTMTSTNYDERDVVGKLFSLCRHNRSKEVETMLDGGMVTVELRGEGGLTPLMVACMVSCAKLLTPFGCDPSSQRGALFSQAGHKRTVKALLKRFAEINPRDVSHCHHLSRDALHEFLPGSPVAAPLSLKRAPVLQDEGRTALHCCLKYGHRDLAEYLISKGADDTLQDSQVTTAVNTRWGC